MDWRLLTTTFVTIFLAELGDKTQLATFAFASGGKSRWAIFLGSSLALIATSAIAVLAGEAVGKILTPKTVTRGAALLFLLLGGWMLYSSVRAP